MMAGAMTAHGAARAAAFHAVLVLVTIAAWLAALSVPSLAQAPVAVEVSEADGFGRIVLTFPETLPDYEVRATTGVIVLDIDQPITLNVGRISVGLPTYAAAARLDPDGGALRLALAREVTVNTMEAGEKLFLDLLPRDWVGLPPGLPQEVVDELARRADEDARRRAEQERLERLANARPADLHIARLPTFTRFVFSWDGPVSAEINRSLDHLTVSFDDFALLELSGFKSRLPDYVTDISGANGQDGYVAEFRVDPESTVRGFKEDDTYVVDITERGTTDISAGPGIPASAEEALLLQGAVSDEEPAVAPEPETGADPVIQTQSPLPVDETETSGPQAVAEGQVAAPPPGTVRADARLFGSSVRLVFPFRERTPSAVFGRGGALWLVFDTSETIEVAALRHALKEVVTGLEVDQVPGRSVVRLELARPMLTTAETEEAAWVITLGDTVLETGTPLELQRVSTERHGPAIRASFREARKVHRLHDPAGGGTLIVVTAEPPARGLPKLHQLVDFTALSTVHGLAISPTADDLDVSIDAEGVLIARANGLILSDAVTLAGYSPAKEAAMQPERPGFVDVNTEGVLDSGVVYRLISDYVRAAAEASEDERTVARLRLARALLATGMGAEALGQLDLISREDPAVQRVPAVRALRGVALALMHRPEAALAELRSYGLGQSSDVALWRGLALSQLGDWRQAHKAMQEGEPALGSYSAGRQRMFGLAATRAAIEVRDTATAAVRLALLRDVSEEGAPDVALLEGRLAELLGDSDAALRAYETAGETGDGAVHIEARLRGGVLAGKEGRLDGDAVIEELETLSIIWRGDDLELTTLRSLANLVVARGDYRRGFELMKSATIADPESSTTRGVQDDMQLAFERLFLSGEADRMDPVDALALYYDYRELTPVGRKGDEMIRALADRLVDVDLLDQATELLAHQVDERLTGAARAQVASRLAYVHLMNRKPVKALNVIARTRQAVLPEAVHRQRAVIEASALSETGRTDLALDLLESLEGTGDNVQRLKADALWRARRWQEAAETFELLLGSAWSGGGALDVGERRDVLRCAIAYSFAEDRLGLDRIRSKFLSKLADSPDAEAFDLVTLQIPGSAASFDALVREVAAIDTLDAFLAEYRAQYGAEPIEPEGSSS